MISRRGLLAASAVSGITGVGHAASTPRVIFDSDIGPDVDDAGTAAVLHALRMSGEIKLIGMACCTSSPHGPTCLSALSRAFGDDDIPVGTFKGPGFLLESKYNRQVAEKAPGRLRKAEDAPEAFRLYRRLLERQPDQAVILIATGPLNNVALLLDSQPDSESPLTGMELARRKISRLVVMGGRYPSGKEWNFEQAPSAAARVCDGWPGPILFSGFEIGSRVFTGKRLQQEVPEGNLLRLAYELYVGPGKARESWDQTAAYAAVRGLGDLWTLQSGGVNRVDVKTGANDWRPALGGRHSYLVERAKPSEVEAAIEDLMIAAALKRKPAKP